MEYPIAIAAAAGLYTIMDGGKDNDKNKESFSNSLPSYTSINGSPQKSVYDYGTSKTMTNNFINKNNRQNILFNNGDKVPQNEYLPLNTDIKRGTVASDSYFNNNNMMSLTGVPVNENNFTHNNMVPFFGSKIKGVTIDTDHIAESILDNMTGTGSQSFVKEEVAPLFKPEESMQWSHGAPNMNDFIQSRQSVTLKQNNIKPWQETREAPGLRNGEEFTGLNTGMGAREAWMPKSVDELRVDTNPKLSFDLNGHNGPAMSRIKNLGIEGKVEQYKPDTYYMNGPERYLTTTGIEKRSTNRALEIMPNVNRIETLSSYSGNAGGGHMIKGVAPENYEGSMRPHIYKDSYGISTGVNANITTEHNNGRGSHTTLPNNRSTVGEDGIFGVASASNPLFSSVNALVSPLVEILRPSKKENVIGNIRINGNVQRSGAGGEYVYETNKPKPTIRETVGHKPYNLNVQRNGVQNGGGYNISNQMSMNTQRTSTNTENFGNALGQGGIRTADAEYAQRNNINRDVYSYTPSGNTDIFNNKINADLVTQRNSQNNRMTSANIGPTYSPNIDTFGQLHGKQELPNNYTDRIQPDMLEAFKKNPFTQSLSSI